MAHWFGTSWAEYLAVIFGGSFALCSLLLLIMLPLLFCIAFSIFILMDAMHYEPANLVVVAMAGLYSAVILVTVLGGKLVADVVHTSALTILLLEETKDVL